MRDILISSTVCVLCLLLALVSQLISPSTVMASTPPAPVATAAAVGTTVEQAQPPAQAQPGRIELDPDDPNPTLFAMAPDDTRADASALGGPLDAPDTTITASGVTSKIPNGSIPCDRATPSTSRFVEVPISVSVPPSIAA